MQIEILKNPGIYFYSGLRKNVQGGGGCKPPPPPLPQKCQEVYNIYIYTGHFYIGISTTIFNYKPSNIDFDNVMIDHKSLQ